MKNYKKIQYITSPSETDTITQIVEKVCKSGIRWVQFRQKNVTIDEFEREAIKVQNICKKYNAVFIVNDNVDIAKKIHADGVHLGKNDISPVRARELLGDDAIIGGTANTFSDIQELNKIGIDYIGLGPYRFTTTKKNLSPILGINGYTEIIRQCKIHNIKIPIYAIGGITNKDVKPILNTGIYGIAVSAEILTLITHDLFD